MPSIIPLFPFTTARLPSNQKTVALPLAARFDSNALLQYSDTVIPNRRHNYGYTITIPKELEIDAISRRRGISRSGFITAVLREKLVEERQRTVREAYDRVFSDEAIGKEQLETASWLEKGSHPEGREW